MQPIDELQSAEARQLLGIVFDVDDTLTRAGRLEAEAYAALWTLRRAGLLLMAVTGRPLGFAELMARQWPIDLAVGENGAGYVRVTEHGLTAGFYADAAQRAQDAAQLARLSERVRELAPFARITDDSWARRCDVTWDIGERVQLAAAQIAELRAIIEAEGARCVVSSVHAHAMLGTYDKASGAVLAGRALLGPRPGRRARAVAVRRRQWQRCRCVRALSLERRRRERARSSARVADTAALRQPRGSRRRFRGDRRHGAGAARLTAMLRALPSPVGLWLLSSLAAVAGLALALLVTRPRAGDSSADRA